MYRLTLTAALTLALTGVAHAALELFVFPLPQYSLQAGSALPASLPAANGQATALPAGRVLLWVEGARALSGEQPPLYALPDLLRVTVPLGRNLLIFSSSQDQPLPARARRSGVAARFPGMAVLYDERGALRDARDRASASLSGLYLLQDRQVVCRYATAAEWQVAGIRGAIVNDVRGFLRTGKVDSCPESVGVPGARVATAGLPGAGKVRLLLRVTGTEADAPPGSVAYTLEVRPDGSTTEKVRSSHPAAEARARLDLLTPLVKAAGAVPIALVSNTADLDRLRRTWPDWTFLPNTPANALRWAELQGTVLAPDGRVKLAFIATGAASPFGVETLRAALREP